MSDHPNRQLTLLHRERMAPHTMSREEVREFLLARPARTGKLALVRSDGQPIVTPVWYDLDGDDLVFNTGEETTKGRILRRDPRLALCVDDERPPFSFVTIQGEAELSDDLPAVRDWAERIGARYMGATRGAEYGARNGVPGELLVRVRPIRVTSQADLAD
jgi:PPOX class probable F420-dependent enzyme